MTQIGQSTQYQPNIIQNSPQQNAQKTIQKQAQNEQKNSSPTSQNQNFQKTTILRIGGGRGG